MWLQMNVWSYADSSLTTEVSKDEGGNFAQRCSRSRFEEMRPHSFQRRLSQKKVFLHIPVGVLVASAVLSSISTPSHSLSRSHDCRCLAGQSLLHRYWSPGSTGSFNHLSTRLVIRPIDLSFAIVWTLVAGSHSSASIILSVHSIHCCHFHMTFSSVIYRANFTLPFCGYIRCLICRWTRSILESSHSDKNTFFFIQHLVSHVFIREDTYVQNPPPQHNLCQWVVRRVQVVNTIHKSMKRMMQYVAHLVSVIFSCTIWWCYSLRIHWLPLPRDSGFCVDRLSAYRLVIWGLLLSEDFGNKTRCPVYLSL